MKIKRISQSEWDLVYPALEHLSIKTIKTARDILGVVDVFRGIIRQHDDLI
ncbi:hypothetical protein [Photorhabdus sp. SF281]|uniref:hypothetical protein n=1 Tax=Photorhabdus sp. SF281 TaxID=3459527 RepID=UPI004044ACF3